MRIKRFVYFVLLLLCLPVAIAALLTLKAIREEQRLQYALTKLDEVTTLSELESLIGRSPDVVLPPSTDSQEGLSELFWARIVERTDDPHVLDSLEDELRRKNDDYLERIPGAVVQSIVVHAYVTRDGKIFAVYSVSNWELKQFFREKIAAFLHPIPAIRTAPIFVAPGIIVLPSAESESKELCQIPNPAVANSKVFARTKSFLVGNVYIAGNTRTRDLMILKLVGLNAGETLTEDTLRAANKSLVDSGLFLGDDSSGTRPSIVVIDPNGEKQIKDLLVTVTERE